MRWLIVWLALVMSALSAAANAEPPADTKSFRIALMEIELDSKNDAARRLNRIGADFELIPPNAPLEQLRRYEVIYFPAGWGELNGLAGLAEMYRQYLEQGGGLLFAQPGGGRRDSDLHALKLLPFPLEVSPGFAAVNGSVRAYPPGQPHVLMQGTEVADLPYSYSALTNVDPRWTVLAVGKDQPEVATLLAAEVGQGRILVHTHRDEDGHQHIFRDRFVVRMLKWLARRPDEDVQAWDTSLGPRRFPKYVQQLQADYELRIAAEPASVRAGLEQADRLLRNDAQQGSTWTAYRDALKLVHQRRSLAAVPLILKLLADESLSHDNYDDLLYQSLVLLTGRPLIGKTPEQVARQWWFPQKAMMTVELAEMSEVERTVILGELLKIVVHNEPHGMKRDEPLSPGGVEMILKGGYRFYASEYRQVLDERLLTSMLKTASDRDRRWLLLGPLAAMYRLGRAKELPALIRNEKAGDPQRVIAAAALFRVGEPTPVESLIRLLRDASEPDLQQAIVWLLGQSKDPAAIETVVGALRHPRGEVREVAALAVSHQQSPSAIEPLAEQIRQRRDAGADARWFVEALGRIPDPQSAPTLAQLLAETVKFAGPDDDIVRELVNAFSNAVGKSFHESGKSDEEQARNALAWWRETGGRRIDPK